MGQPGARTGTTVGFAIVGAVIGSMAGPGGTALGFAIGSMIGSIIGTLVFPDPNKHTYTPRVGELQLQTSSYGAPIMKVYGTSRLAGNLIWTGGFQEHSQTETTGGKGGGGVDTTSYYYTCSFAFGICKGPMAYLTRIWADGNLIYDVRTSGAISTVGINFRFYLGNETQLPDPLIESFEGVGEVPAHRGLCYIVFEDFPISKYGNRIPVLNFEVCEAVTPSYPYTYFSGVVSIWGIAQLSLAPDDSYVYYFTSNYFCKVNLITGTIDTVETILTGDWMMAKDSDEEGYFYGMGGGSGDWKNIRKYNEFGYPVLSTADVLGFETYYARAGVSCSRNPLYPYIGLYGSLYTTHLSFLNRNTLIPCGLQYYNVSLLTGRNISAQHITWDDNRGIAWVICGPDAFHTDPYTYILKIQFPQIGTLGNISITAYDVTSDIGVGNNKYIGIDSVSGLIFVNATIHSTGSLYMWNPDTNVWTELAGYIGGEIHRIHNHRFFASSGVSQGYHIYDSLSGTIYRTFVWGVGDCYGGYPIYQAFSDSMIVYDAGFFPTPGIYQRYMNRGTPSATTLDLVVKNICEQVGLVNTTDFNVTPLSSTTVRGYIINSRMEARRAIEPLQQVFLFDGVEEDGVIKFKMRGGASVVTIPEVDLSARGETDSPVDPIIITRIQELEIPREINVEYMDIDFDYEIGTQRGRRLITQGKGSQTYNITVVMNKNEARQAAERILALMWKERDKYSLQLGRKYWYLSPTDVITLIVGTKTYSAFIIKLDYGLSGLLKVEATKEDSTIYTNTATGAPGEFVRLPGSSWEGPTTLIILDIPALRDQEASGSPAGMYLVASGSLSAWRGATIYKSSDSGATFSSISSIINSSVIGTVIGTPLPTIPNTNIWDRVNTLNIRLVTPNATLSNYSEDNVLNGYNTAVVGDEIIQFTTAVLEGDGSYTISNLLRGRRGTEYAIGTHASGEYFVLLSTNSTYRYAMESSEINLLRLYRSVSLGLLFTDGVNRSFTNTGKSGKPLSPVHVTGSRDGSNNLTINWIRRTRISGGWIDGSDVPLGEDTEDYEVDVYDGTTIVRTIHITAQTASYTAANQTSDGLTPGNPVHVKIYQISATFGRGFESDATI